MPQTKRSRPACSTERTPGQPGRHGKTKRNKIKQIPRARRRLRPEDPEPEGTGREYIMKPCLKETAMSGMGAHASAPRGHRQAEISESSKLVPGQSGLDKTLPPNKSKTKPNVMVYTYTPTLEILRSQAKWMSPPPQKRAGQ